MMNHPERSVTESKDPVPFLVTKKEKLNLELFFFLFYDHEKDFAPLDSRVAFVVFRTDGAH